MQLLAPTNGQKKLTSLVELGKAERSWGEGRSCRRNSSLNYSGPPRSLKHWTTKQTAYTCWYEAPNTYTVEDFWVSFYSEMMHLTFYRLEAPGSLENIQWGINVLKQNLLVGLHRKGSISWGWREEPVLQNHLKETSYPGGQKDLNYKENYHNDSIYYY